MELQVPAPPQTQPLSFRVATASRYFGSSGHGNVLEVLHRVRFPEQLFLPVTGERAMMWSMIDGCLSCFLLLQFLRTPSSFAFRVVSGPLIFTAISVINALRRSARGSGPFPTVSPLYTVPDLRYQVHTVLQFVPTHVDVRVCNFSQRIERGLMLAYGEACRRSHEPRNVTVQVSHKSHWGTGDPGHGELDVKCRMWVWASC